MICEAPHIRHERASADSALLVSPNAGSSTVSTEDATVLLLGLQASGSGLSSEIPTSDLQQTALGDDSTCGLSADEAGVAEELLALASEASLSSPMSRRIVTSPMTGDLDDLEGTGERSEDMEEEPSGCESAHLPAIAAALPGRHSPLPSIGQVLSASKASHLAGSETDQDPPPVASESSHPGRTCCNCGAKSTPFWRKAPNAQYYCNACGLYLRTHLAPRPMSLQRCRETRRSKARPEQCTNCGARETPMWRKAGLEGSDTVCNACGLYWKLHGFHRQTAPTTEGENASSSWLQSTPPKKRRPGKENGSAASETVNFYSLDASKHHYFHQGLPLKLPAMNSSVLDSRKLAHLKYGTQKPSFTVPLAPKLLEKTAATGATSRKALSPSSIPLLNEFITTLASPDLEEQSRRGGISSAAHSPSASSSSMLSSGTAAHPLHGLLTSIVAEKLMEKRRRLTTANDAPSKDLSVSASSPAHNENDFGNHAHALYRHQQQQQSQGNRKALNLQAYPMSNANIGYFPSAVEYANSNTVTVQTHYQQYASLNHSTEQRHQQPQAYNPYIEHFLPHINPHSHSYQYSHPHLDPRLQSASKPVPDPPQPPSFDFSDLWNDASE